MTEKTAIKKILGVGKPGPRYLIDPRAFIVALIGSPILVTVLLFWLFVPIFALALGGPVYILLATPVMLWWLGRHRPGFWAPAVLGLLSNLAVVGGMYLAILTGFAEELNSFAGFYLIFGSIFAPIWAGVFGILYQAMPRPAFARQIKA